jgi:hypothetical protein
MKQWAWAGWVSAGALLGAIAVVAIVGLPLNLLPAPVLRSLPTPVLGRLLSGDLDTSFVADSRDRRPPIGSIELYPEAVLDAGLCKVSVEVASLAAPRVRDVRQKYGVEPDRTLASCADFRDFANLFEYVGVSEPGEAVAILMQAKDGVRRGENGFDITCEHLTTACDGARALRALNVRHIAVIETLRHEEVGDSTLMTHRYAMHLGGDRTKPPNVQVVIRSQRAEGDHHTVIQDVRITGLSGDVELDG